MLRGQDGRQSPSCTAVTVSRRSRTGPLGPANTTHMTKDYPNQGTEQRKDGGNVPVRENGTEGEAKRDGADAGKKGSDALKPAASAPVSTGSSSRE